MTLTTSHNWIAYTASGGTDFAYTFLILAASDLRVYDNRVLVSSGYTVSGVGVGSGGTVTFTTPPTAGHVVLLLRATDDTQQVNLLEGDALPAESVEGVFDKVYAALQDVRETATRGFGLPVSRAGETPVMPDLDDAGVWGKAVKVNAAGTGLDVFTVLASDVASPITSLGDLIQGGAGGTPARLAVGADGTLLTAASGQAAWTTLAASALALLTVNGDLLYRNGAGAVVRLPIGSAGQVLTVTGGLPAWAALTLDPLTLTGQSTPATPSAGTVTLFAPSGTPLQGLATVDASGQVTTLSRVLIRGTGAPYTEVVSTADPTSIFTTPPTIEGGTLGTDRLLRITLLGDALNATGGTAAFTVRVLYGATTALTLAIAAAGFASSATRHGWESVASLVAAGATGAQFAHGRAWANRVVGVSGGNYAAGNDADTGVSTHNALAEDSTGDLPLDITIEPDASSANLSIRVFLVLVELL